MAKLNIGLDNAVLELTIWDKAGLEVAQTAKVKQIIEYPDTLYIDVVFLDDTKARIHLYDQKYTWKTLEEKYNATPTTELYPGKYTSQNGKWYFSCNTKDSVLVGARTNTSTCGLFGVVNVPVTMEQLVALENNGRLTLGFGDTPSMYIIPKPQWNDIFKNTEYVVFNPGETCVVFATTDMGQQPNVIRFHMDFE